MHPITRIGSFISFILPMIHQNIFCLYGTADGAYIISVSRKTDGKQKTQEIHVMYFFTNEIKVRLTCNVHPLFPNKFVEMSHDILSLEVYHSTFVFHNTQLLSNRSSSRITMNENRNTNQIGTQCIAKELNRDKSVSSQA